MCTIRRVFPFAAALAVMLAAAVPAPRARACMPGFWHPRQDAIILWHDGVEVLIWRTLVSNTPPPGANVAPNAARPTGNLAWLLVAPSAPIAFEIEELEPFENTLTWAQAHEAPEPPGGGGGVEGGRGDGFGGIQVGATQTVGDYEVTPITGTGSAAATALNAWLRQNHFPHANEDAVRSYVQQNATFLAVKARYPTGADAAKLRPLAIAFRSGSIVVPIKLSAGEPAYSLGVTIFSSRKPENAGGLNQGMRIRQVVQPGVMLGTPNPGRDAAQVPHVSIPAAMRALATRLVGRVPQMQRMESGALWFMRIEATPLQPDASASVPDPSLRLGEAAYGGNDAIPGEAEPTRPITTTTATTTTSTSTSTSTAAADADEDCSVVAPGARSALGWLGLALMVALGVLVARRGRQR